MKIYLKQNGVTLVGKSWEIRVKLKEYSKQFSTVHEWVSSKESKNLDMFKSVNKMK